MGNTKCTYGCVTLENELETISLILKNNKVTQSELNEEIKRFNTYFKNKKKKKKRKNIKKKKYCNKI